MHRAGMTSAEICRELGISRQQLVHEMNLAEDDEKYAHLLGLDIYDERIKETE